MGEDVKLSMKRPPQAVPAYSQDIVIKKGEQEGVGGVTIGRIPLMLRSDRCVLKGKSEDELACLGERFPCVPAFPCVHEGSCDIVIYQCWSQIMSQALRSLQHFLEAHCIPL
jgi:RNA polymerase beta subunit